MDVVLEQVAKRFQKNWIFRNLTYTFKNEHRYAILGANGSGKSTLLRLLAGMQNPSKGKIRHTEGPNVVATHQLHNYVSFSAPGQELIEEMTLIEFLNFHFSFKPPLSNLSVKDVIGIIGLQMAANIPIADFSSGMKQRVKLAQAIFSNTPILLLDEPCTNLDQNGIEQYLIWMDNYSQKRLVVIASNDPKEYAFCNEHILLADYK